MTSYRRVRVDFWNHPKTSGLGVVEKAVVLCLATWGHPACIEHASLKRLRNAIDSSLPLERIDEALAKLVAMVRWDPDREIVWLIEGLDEQAGHTNTSAKLRTSVLKHLESLPLCDLTIEYAKRYPEWSPDVWHTVSALEPGQVIAAGPRLFYHSEPIGFPSPAPAPAIAPPVLTNGKRSKAKAKKLEHRDAALRLWAMQDELRRTVSKTARALAPTEKALLAVCERIAEHGEDACKHVLHVSAAEERRRGKLEWFDGVSNWRPDNFLRKLGRDLGNEAKVGHYNVTGSEVYEGGDVKL